MNLKPVYTPKQVAALLEMTPRTVTNWCADGHIRAEKVCKSWIIPRAEVARLLGVDLGVETGPTNKPEAKSAA